MRKILLVIAVLMLFTPMTAYAKEESAMDLYNRDRDAFYKKYMCLDKEAEEQGLYSDANNGEFTKKKNKSNKSDSKTSYSYSGYSGYVGEAKGWVYGVDELHVVGLPVGEDGYTLQGDYGIIH